MAETFPGSKSFETTNTCQLSTPTIHKQLLKSKHFHLVIPLVQILIFSGLITKMAQDPRALMQKVRCFYPTMRYTISSGLTNLNRQRKQQQELQVD
jgi:hypothetical protein